MLKRYRVIGPNRVFEHGPGQEFERDLTDAERTLVGVHIRLVEPTPDPQPEKATPKRRAKNPKPQSEE